MDLTSWLQKVHNQFEKAIKNLDTARGQLPEGDQLESTHLECAALIAMSLAYMESVVTDPDDRLRLLKMGTTLKEKFHFVSMNGESVEAKSSPLIVSPHGRGIIVPS